MNPVGGSPPCSSQSRRYVFPDIVRVLGIFFLVGSLGTSHKDGIVCSGIVRVKAQVLIITVGLVQLWHTGDVAQFVVRVRSRQVGGALGGKASGRS
jgi:hypothetical protein